jgi:prepilin peptidase CpaA
MGDLDIYNVCLVVAAAAAVLDGATGRIPNWITYPAILFGLGWWMIAGGVAGLSLSFAAMLVAAVPFLLAFIFGGGGGGDVKIMAAAGAILSFPAILPVMAHALAVGAVMALGALMLRGRVTDSFGRLHRMIVLLPLGLQQASGLKIADRDEISGAVTDPEAPLRRPGAVGVRFGIALFAAMVWLKFPILPKIPGI